MSASRQDEVPLVVDTPSGRLRGVREAGLTAWRGVPYAEPPIGALRLRAPRPHPAWPGVRDATRDGPLPPQPRATRLTGAGPRTPMSEDCLTLTLVRRTRGTAPKPVMVFVHGGAFGVGGVSATAYAGEALAARQDVLVVGFTYRLGALGWLDASRHGTAERPIEANLGLRDQLLALEWVRDHVAAFGGDPDDVTLFGESAGGTAVLTLMAVPRARGLFHRAIVQSATVGAVHAAARSRDWADELVALLPGGADDLLTADPAVLVAATNRLDLEIADRQPAARLLGPVVDGDLVPEHPLDVLREGRAVPVPLIIGTNAGEGTLFQLFPGLRATPARLDRLFALTVPESSAGILAAYPARPRRRLLAHLVTDLMFWHSSVTAAAGHAAVAPVWMYRFDFAPPAMRLAGLGAMHGAELDHVFARADAVTRRAATLLGGRRAARALTRRMSAAWAGFARTGEAPARWPRFDAEHRRTLVLDAADRVEQDPSAAARAAWDRWRPYG